MSGNDFTNCFQNANGFRLSRTSPGEMLRTRDSWVVPGIFHQPAFAAGGGGRGFQMSANHDGSLLYRVKIIASTLSVKTCGIFPPIRFRLVSNLLFLFTIYFNPILTLGRAYVGEIYNGRRLEF